MKYGFFDDKAKEYVIETPYTPLPWINYLGNNDFFSLISNTAGGYSFFKDAKLMRITRYRYNNVPSDTSGRCYYIKEGDTVFSPAFLPTKTSLDSYRCRHGLGYTIFESSKNNIFTELKCFVPLESACEINQLKIKNSSDKTKKITLYSAIEWCLWNAVDDLTNFQRNLNIGEVEVENSTIFHKTEYRERRNHYAFFGVNSKINGFDTDRFTFLGHFNGWDTPEQVTNSTSGNTIASGWSPIASHRIEFELEPNEEKSFIFILGYAENHHFEKFIQPDVLNKLKAYKILKDFDSDKKVDKAFKDLTNYWINLLSTLNVDTPIKQLNRSVNIWNQYQCMVTFNMSRSASYFESGTGRGMGFRDSCQDLLGFVHIIPEKSRERIIDIASIQFEDGSTYHQYQPLTKRGNADIGSGFNDDPLWLIACVTAYIKETGDYSILNTPIPFNNLQGSEKPLFEHLRRTINYTINNIGPHGLPLIGRADWNDCLNLNCFSTIPGESFQTCSNFESGKAESVFIAGMFVKYGKEYAELCKRFGDKNEANTILLEVEKLQQSVLDYGWDGNWFLRAYDAFEKKLGSHENIDGKIYIEPQGFCVMAGIGGKEYGQKALDSVDKFLVNDYGIEILNPAYKEYHIKLGEISSYPRGYKENGSVFCHNNLWIILAHTTIGNGDKAFNLFTRSCPTFIEDISHIRKTEPYVYSQTIAGRDAPNYGLAKNSWLTGTASWAMVASSQGILGIQADFDGLRISPCLPKEITAFTAIRKFRGVTYNINVICDKQGYLTVNGEKINGNLIPIQNKDCKIDVHV
jgi:cellobiose phosphorylase